MQAIKRYPHTLYNETALNIPKPTCNRVFQDQTESSNDCSNSKHVGNTGFGTCGTIPKLPIHFLSGSEGGWISSAHIQPERLEQVRNSEKFSIIQPFSSTRFSTRQRLVNKAGLISGLLPPAYCTRSPQVPEDELQRKTDANDLPSIRTVISPTHVCLGHELDCRIPEKPQHQVCNLFRRFSSRKSVSRDASSPDQLHGEVVEATRMDNKLRQICAGSDSTFRISRRHLGYQTQFKIPVGTKMPNATQGIAFSDVEGQLVFQTSPVTSRETQFRHVCDSSRETSLSNDAVP